MAPKSLLLASAAVVVGAAFVSAQAAPNWMYFPSACSDQCSVTIEVAYSCETQYSNSSGTDIYACFCNAFPSDATTCASCLSSNDAAALSSLLTSSQTDCPTEISSCSFACAITPCASSDIACQCSATYLEDIFTCGSCNTANGNTGSTQLSDFQALQESCANQNYTGASMSFTTNPLPSPTTANYVAPSLTATGGGAAATGDLTASGAATAGQDDTTAAVGAGSASTATAASGSGSDSTATGSAATGAGSSGSSAATGSAAASGSRSASAASGAASASGSAASSSSSSSSSSGNAGYSVPAFGGVLAIVGGALVALF